MVRQFPHLLGHLVGKTKLTALHSQWIWECWGSEDHYSLQAHRGSFKTTSITEVGAVWFLLFFPSTRIAIVRETWKEAVKTLGTIKKYMNSEPIRQLFAIAHGFEPRLQVKREDALLYNFKGTITKENTLDAYGIDQIPTGSHYDKIVLDDIITLRDRLSPAKRERTDQAVREILTNIIDPGKQVIAVGTTWHKKDSWRLLPPASRYTVSDTGILTPEQIAAKKATTTPSLWAANYELRHEADADLMFANPNFGDWARPKFCRVTAHLDAKFGGKDTNALTITYQDPKTGNIHVHGRVFHEHIKEKDAFVRNAVFEKAGGSTATIWNETNPDKGFVAGLLALPQGVAGHRLDVQTYHESTNKHHKIVSFLKLYWGRLVFDPNCDEEYLAQVSEYREGAEPDDAPDSLASVLRQAYYSSHEANPENDSALYEE